MGYTWKHMYISKIGIDKSKNNFALASQGEGVSLTVTGADQRCGSDSGRAHVWCQATVGPRSDLSSIHLEE